MLFMLTTSCSTQPTTPSTTPVTPPATSTSQTPTASSTSPTDEATTLASQAALASYAAFWRAKVQSQADPAKAPPSALSKYAIDKALADAQATVLLLRRNGVAMTGAPTHSPAVIDVSLGATPTVQISDCLDSSHWTPVFVATGKSALAPGQATRVVVDSTATTFAGRWVIRTSVAHRDQTC